MAETVLSKVLSHLNILREDRKIVLKPEQETAVSESLHGRDVMAVWQKHDFYCVRARLTRIVNFFTSLLDHIYKQAT